MLSITIVNVFLRVSALVKLSVMVATSAQHIILIYRLHEGVLQMDSRTDTLPWSLYMRSVLYELLLIAMLMVLSRQVERSLRLDFLWKTRIQEEREKVLDGCEAK